MSFATASFSTSSRLHACGRWLVKGCCVMLLTLPPAFISGAQDAGPDLRPLRAQLRQELLKAALPEQKAQREALLALEKKHAAAQDYASAIKARDERLRIEQEIALMERDLAVLGQPLPATGAARAPERIELSFKEATLAGVRLDTGDNSLTGWNATGASVTWKLPSLPPGGYEISLNHQGGEGNVLLKESFYTLTSNLKPASGKPMTQTLGTLRVRDGGGSLTLTVGPPEKCGSLRIYSVVLVPAAR